MTKLLSREEIDEAIALLGVAADLLINFDAPFPRLIAAEYIYGDDDFAAFELAVAACEVARVPWRPQTDLELLQGAHDLDEERLPPGYALKETA